MTKTTIDTLDRLVALGFTVEESQTLRRIAMTLRRWGELECGDGNDYASWAVERDDKTGKPYIVTYPHTGQSYRRPIADRENGALLRLRSIMARHPELWAHHQTDPRGCAIYIGRKSDLQGRSVAECYTLGTAVC